jgi:DNA invertase Pin-like site-specific DNA recombinase
MAKRAALYSRVSTSDQTCENQLRDLRAVARQRGWSVVQEFVDSGISGAKHSRPALDQLVDHVRRGKVDVIAVAGLDRLGRSTTHVLSLLEEFNVSGVEFVSLREGVDSRTPAGKLVLSILASVAELERELIRDRVRAGLRRAKAQGVKLGRKPVQVDRAAIVYDHHVRNLSQRELVKKYGASKGTVSRILKSAPKTPSRSAVAGD